MIYFAAEGGTTFANRVAALDAPEFWLHAGPLVLTGKDTQAGPVAEVLQHLGAVGGSPFIVRLVASLYPNCFKTVVRQSSA